MNLLLDDAPKFVKVGEDYKQIAWDYRTGIRFEMLMLNSGLSDIDKLSQALALYYGDQEIADIEDAVMQMLWFFECGKRGKDTEREGKQSYSDNRKIYDYAYDAEYIYAAFLQQFGIDLQSERLHWWIFKALFRSLSEETEFVKIMGYRSIEIDSNMTKSQKAFYQKMKRIHALPLPDDEQQKLSAIEEALMNGGDLSGLLGAHK